MLQKLLIPALLATLAAGAANASEQIKICSQYYRSTYHSWSKPWARTAYLMTGTELNQTVNSATYEAGRKYVVITWKKKNDYTAIRVPDDWSGSKDEILKDQKQRDWRLHKGWTNCSQ